MNSFPALVFVVCCQNDLLSFIAHYYSFVLFFYYLHFVNGLLIKTFHTPLDNSI